MRIFEQTLVSSGLGTGTIEFVTLEFLNRLVEQFLQYAIGHLLSDGAVYSDGMLELGVRSNIVVKRRFMIGFQCDEHVESISIGSIQPIFYHG